MSAEHTPGPWRIGLTGDIVADAPSGHDDPSNVDWYGGHLIAESVPPHNRPIIKAAPDMLTALRQLIADARPCNWDDEEDLEQWRAWVAAHAAIAKAEGRA